MLFKNIVKVLKDMKNGIGNKISRRRKGGKTTTVTRKLMMRRNHGRSSHIAPERCLDSSFYALLNEKTQWANLPPELLIDIIQRLEASEPTWPARRDVVACATVCRSWRDVTKEVVKTPEKCGSITFPISLTQPGPRDFPIQCFIKRERRTSTYRLYLGLSPALSGDMSKMLLAARRIRRATATDFVISLLDGVFSRSSRAYVGKLRSNFLGTKFTVYDNQSPYDSATNLNGLHLNRVSSAPNNNSVAVSYELNILRTRGPRRMHCVMHSIPASSIQEGGTAPTPEKDSSTNKKTDSESLKPIHEQPNAPLILKNNAPMWHGQLQCWCLNFKGRVTVASVKNFQLVAAVDPGHNVSVDEQEKVILQFGKIGKDVFTMDYRYPLSAFQAFAICLSSFDSKPACE